MKMFHTFSNKYFKTGSYSGNVLQTLPVIYNSVYSDLYVLRHNRVILSDNDHITVVRKLNYKIDKNIIVMRYFGSVDNESAELFVVLYNDSYNCPVRERGVHLPEVSSFQNDTMYNFPGKIQINSRPIIFAYLQHNISINYSTHLI